MTEPETNERLEAELRQALKSNAADDRSGLEKAEAIVDRPFRVVKLGGKVAILLLVVVLIGAAVWFFALRDSGSSQSQSQVVSQKTRTISSVGGDPTKTAPEPPASSAPQPMDGTPTSEQWALGGELMNLNMSVISCLSQKHLLGKSSEFAADYCSNPANLKLDGFTLGNGPDQVQVSLSVQQTSVSKPRTVHYASGKTQVIPTISTYNNIVGAYSGMTADGSTLSFYNSNLIVNSDNQAVFAVIVGAEQPCLQKKVGQACLAQPVTMDDYGDVLTYGSRIEFSRIFPDY